MNTARLNQGTPLLLNAVSKHYAENIVLNQLDLHIPAGQFVAVVYSAAIFLIPICISFDTAEKRRYATYLILNRRFSFEF